MIVIPFLALAICILTIPAPVLADCECGYIVNNVLYTDSIESDFLHLQNITTDQDWQPQEYTTSAALSRGPYGKSASVSNVIANPLSNPNDWIGKSELGGDAGLQLIVRGGIPGDGLVSIAELATFRTDLLYGSFRAGMKLTGNNGTCGAFFWVGGTDDFQLQDKSCAWLIDYAVF